MKNPVKERVCGGCCYFMSEDTDGFGFCPHVDISVCEKHCSDSCSCGMFVSEEEKRHHLAVLRKCQRCLNGVDNKDLDVKAIGEAIDFVVEYAKMF